MVMSGNFTVPEPPYYDNGLEHGHERGDHHAGVSVGGDHRVGVHLIDGVADLRRADHVITPRLRQHTHIHTHTHKRHSCNLFTGHIETTGYISHKSALQKSTATPRKDRPTDIAGALVHMVPSNFSTLVK